MTIDPNYPSIPCIYQNQDGTLDYQSFTGLTIHAELAARAMQGMLANYEIINANSWEWIAKESVKMADELINQLNKSIQ